MFSFQSHRMVIPIICSITFIAVSLSNLYSAIKYQQQSVTITPIAWTTKIEIEWSDGKGSIDLANFGGRNIMKDLDITVLPKFFGRVYYSYQGEIRAVFALPGAKCMFTVAFSHSKKNVLVFLPPSLEKYHGHINSCGALALSAMPKSVKHGYVMTYTKEGYIYILGPDGSAVIDTTCSGSLQKQFCAHFWMKTELVDSTMIVDKIGHGHIDQHSTWNGRVLKLTAYFTLEKDFLKYEHFFFKDGRHERLDAILLDSLTVPIENMNASGTDSTNLFILPAKQK